MSTRGERRTFAYLVNRVGVGRGVLVACKKERKKEDSANKTKSLNK